MIGLAFLALQYFLALAFGTAGALLVRRAWRERRWVRLLPAAFFALAGPVLAVQLTIDVVHVLRLRRLAAGGLQTAAVGDTVIAERAAVDDVAACLAGATWYSGVHEPARDLALVGRDGGRRSWSVAARRKGGAVVDFGLLHEATGLRRGQAFVACLPEVLRRHGAALE